MREGPVVCSLLLLPPSTPPPVSHTLPPRHVDGCAACFEVFRGLAGTTRRISANTANEYLEILSFGLVDREREAARPAPRVGNFKRRGQSFAEQVDAEIVHCGYRITRDIVSLRFLRPSVRPPSTTPTSTVRSHALMEWKVG